MIAAGDIAGGKGYAITNDNLLCIGIIVVSTTIIPKTSRIDADVPPKGEDTAVNGNTVAIIK